MLGCLSATYSYTKETTNSPPSDFVQIDILTTKQFSLKVLRVLLLNPPFTNLPEWVVITSHLKKMHQKKILMWNGLWLCGWNLARIKAFCSLMHECIWCIVNRYYDLSIYIIENLEQFDHFIVNKFWTFLMSLNAYILLTPSKCISNRERPHLILPEILRDKGKYLK